MAEAWKCRVVTVLTTREYQRLDAVPDGANEVSPMARCSLEPGHTGPHQCLGQVCSDGSEFWLAWDEGGLREIRHTAGCPARTPEEETGEPEPCLFADGHPGRHSFDLTQVGPPESGWTVGHLRRAMAGLRDNAPLRIDLGDRRVFDGGVQPVITGATVGHWWAERPVGVDGTPPVLNVEPKYEALTLLLNLDVEDHDRLS
ncbi:hypothetical protein [Streptomyces swartbergensis]|uniref:hypothetical protein n=1 Tax=Streptomyces swartbergensis TaxID=487165 RepID=UPI0038265FD5